MPAVFAILLVVIAVVATAWLIRNHSRKVRWGWAEAARRLGGTYEPKVGPWYRRTSHLNAVIDGQSTLIDHYTIHTGQTSITYTRCTAPVDFAGDLELKIYAKGFFAKLGEGLGAQDVKTGDVAFDEAFMVKASDEARARAWLTPEVRAAITRLGDHRLTLEGGQLKAERANLETDPDRLQRLAEVTAAVARRGAELRQFWQKETAERGGVIEEAGRGHLRIAIDGDSVPLRIDTHATGEGGTEIVARRLSAGGERFVLSPNRGSHDWAIESDDPELTRRRISPEIGERLDRLAPLRVEANEDELRIVTTGIEGDAERLAEVVALAEELAAADPRGAYR
ncbi:MAG: hypothetical protein RIF41_15450 [Polyangiaceae bacterium]